MSAELLQAKRVRASIIGLMTKQRKSFDEHQEELSISGITVMSNVIDGFYNRYTDISVKVNELATGDEVEEAAAIEKDAEFAETYVNLKTELLELLEQRRPKTEQLNMSVNSSSKSVKLPKLELPKFSGLYHGWTDFKNEFTSMILDDNSLSNVDKFRYLKSSLSGQAKMIIANMEMSDANFDVAWTAICDRYENASLIFRAHINEILSLQGSSGATDGCRALLDRAQAHYRSLQSLGSAEQIAENFLITIIVEKLDEKAQSKWEETATNDIPSWKTFSTFLEKYSSSLARIASNKPQRAVEASKSPGKFSNPRSGKNATLSKSFVSNGTSASVTSCPECKKTDHTIVKCPSFALMSPSERYERARALRLCIACLVSEHSPRFCKSRCSVCSRRHNTLLHFPTNPKGTEGTNLFAAKEQLMREHVLLASVTVFIYADSGDLVPCNAVLDSGSTDHYISDRLARLVNAPRTRDSSLSGGIGNCIVQSKGKCSVTFTSRFGNSGDFEINPTILHKITDSFPSKSFDIDNWNIPPHLSLADPNFNIPKHIDLLIGGGLFWQLLTMEKLQLGPDLPLLFGTVIGYIVVGPYVTTNLNRQTTLMAQTTDESSDFQQSESLDNILQRFWEIDSFTDSVVPLKPADQYCLDFYASTTRRDETGRYVVRLPFKTDPSKLGSSLEIATRRFYNLERRLDREPHIKRQYLAFIDEYQQLGHLEVVENFDPNAPHYFLPHHCVLKPTSSSTKLRVVFDASCKTSNGLSLNDVLHPGPKLQNDLLITVLRFQLYPFVATADIQKMYRQVGMDKSDANYQLILWRDSKTDPLQVLRLTTVTYGTAPGAFLAVNTLFRLAEDEGKNYPEGSKVLKDSFYVDDAMVGAKSVVSLREKLKQLTELLGRGGMTLSKFCSNSNEILSSVPLKDREKLLQLNDHSIVKALGMFWDPECDVWRYSLELSDMPIVTKRAILSEVARIFDPPGFLCPMVTKAKFFLKQIWFRGLDWDTPLPEDLRSSYLKFRHDFGLIRNVIVPRYILDGLDYKSIQIHGFSDASELAYGACVYIRVHHSDDRVSVRLLTAKSRIAPSKVLTIARLELCAAALLYRMIERLKKEVFHDEPVQDVFYWTDSSIVLSWLNGPPCSWKTFVAHRVAKIQENSSVSQWFHVPGEQNPADLLSRGMDIPDLVSSGLWWKGPSFLHKPDIEFPDEFVLPDSIEQIPEFKPAKTVLFAHKIEDLTAQLRFPLGYRGACRTFAYVLRFIENCRKPPLFRPQRHALRLKSLKDLKPIYASSTPTIREEDLGEMELVRIVQRSSFPSEYDCLLNDKRLAGNSPLLSVAPFLDKDDGLLRVGGRLEKANIPFDSRHQILLPKRHILTRLLFEYYHQHKLFHAGPQTVLSAIRLRYWPIGGLKLARSITSKCVWCFRLHPKLMSQLMGQLPKDRTVPQDIKPFVVSGVDFAGPLRVRHHVRCKQQKEVHLALFICFVTKAIHIELVPDRSTPAFIRALKRFIADRGTVSKIYSDNATNFRGAANYLKELGKTLESDCTQIENDCRKMQIEWSFIPPRTPHQGGLWESSIKLLKRTIKGMVGDTELTQDELQTVAKQAASIVNSRPLTPMSADPNDLQPLTPGHFLFCAPPTAIIEPPIFLENINQVKLTYRIRFLLQKIWERFYRDYLAILQVRSKWRVQSRNLSTGDMVLLKEDNVPPLKWPIGRVVDVKEDSHGDVRAATVKTKVGTYERGITKLALLPLDDEQ